jgi:hypothetical protein
MSKLKCVKINFKINVNENNNYKLNKLKKLKM